MKYAKKSLGQNFLIDKNIVNKIINLTDIENKNILEIGPGKGILTEQILKRDPKSLILVEKDNALSELLNVKYKQNKKIKIYNEDIMKFDLKNRLKRDTIIFGNLPYNISSQILVKIIRLKNNPCIYSALIFMFQKELADRIIGKFGTNKYGRLSILAGYRLNILRRFNVSPNCFHPKPKINSTVILFQPNSLQDYKIKDIKNLEKITNIFFSNQRKMINKCVKKIFKNTQKFEMINNLNLKLRPADLKPKKYYQITELFEKI